MAGGVMAQDDCDFPAERDTETGECDLTSGLQITVRVPAWLADYPDAMTIVDAFLAAVRRDYLLTMAEEPYRYLGRALVLEVDYQAVWHSDTVVSLLFTRYADYGWLYPDDSLHSFTFDLEADRLLTISDLLREDVTPGDAFGPILTAHFTPDELTGLYITDRLDDPAIYETFTLGPDALTLIYPTGRQGPIHAGTLSVTIPLDDLQHILNPDIFSD
jgi:hypothetical protein